MRVGRRGRRDLDGLGTAASYAPPVGVPQATEVTHDGSIGPCPKGPQRPMRWFVRRANRTRQDPPAPGATDGAAQSVGDRIGAHVGDGEVRIPAGPSGLWGALAERAGDEHTRSGVVAAVDPGMFPTRIAGGTDEAQRRVPAGR